MTICDLEDKVTLRCATVNFPAKVKLLTFLVSYSIHHVIGMIPRYFMQNINHVIDVNETGNEILLMFALFPFSNRI